MIRTAAAVALVLAAFVSALIAPDERPRAVFLAPETAEEAPVEGSAGEVPVEGSADSGPSRLSGSIYAHDAGGAVAIPSGFEGLAFDAASFERRGAESAIAVHGATGATVAVVSARAFRSTDGGASWTDITHPAMVARGGIDAIGLHDPDTDRIYIGLYAGACLDLYWSDDGGASWAGYRPNICPLGAITDHPKIAVGPRLPGIAVPSTIAPYPNALYLAWNTGFVGAKVAVSLDGGLTWPLVGSPTTGDACGGGITGPIAVHPSGRLVVPLMSCDGYRMASTTDLSTWDETFVPALPHSDPGIALDASGVLHLFTLTQGGGLEHRTSPDGATWTGPSVASPPHLSGVAHSFAVAGDPGRVAVFYLGTDDGSQAPPCVPDGARWLGHVTYSLDANTPDPTWVTVELGSEQDPFQIGSIIGGFGLPDCVPPSGSRNLLEYNWVALRPDGRLQLAYADGCTWVLDCNVDPQARASASRDKLAMSAWQTGGPGLFAD